MTEGKKELKNVLIIRADNMGDLIMSSPAIRALKHTFSCKITVLTSSMAAAITPFIPEIDDVLIFDLPWVKAAQTATSQKIFEIVQQLNEKNFDAAIIFTVFSQTAMPAAMIAYMANIPLRLAYSRENPYDMLTHWVPDAEPFRFIKHQVTRDLELVKTLGAVTKDAALHLVTTQDSENAIFEKMALKGLDLNRPWLVCHAGVSEKKREYPQPMWVQAAQKLIAEGFQILFSGSASEKDLCNTLAEETGQGSFSVAGLFNLGEFIALLKKSPVVISVNTGTIHIAAAVKTPVVVLYAQTNPQHTPWMSPNVVLEFEVKEDNRSKNEIIQFLYEKVYNNPVPFPGPDDICRAVYHLLKNKAADNSSRNSFR